MTTKASASPSGGIGFAGLLTILFIGLKLSGIIDWSWWWVLSPLWISLLVALAIPACIFLGMLGLAAWRARK
ncbi:hypothetical protein [Ralstonia sp.]|uniref:hypothetical protein n=1 Tax=Ralstonia sp. TaxID=54061 RepID=UPI00257DAF25|nr:hypothetical protein [Ralstonia sp.]MBA4282216.1 hypothetical protein [Ralstonia sp.]